MSHLIYTQQALCDLVRLRNFLAKKSPEASIRAVAKIKSSIQKIALQPNSFRPVEDMPNYREIIIDFGGSEYIVRFYYKTGSDIKIVRIKHQLED